MKTIIAVLLLISTITSCGQMPAATEAVTEDEKAGDDNYIDYAEDEKEIVTEYKRVGSVTAIALANTSDLPECSNATDGLIAFIKAESQFYTCDLDLWVQIDLRGANGATGPQGPIGPAGPAAQPLSPNHWLDPISQLLYMVGSQGNRTQADQTCASPYRVPTSQELFIGANRGLGLFAASLQASPDAWASEFYQNDNQGIPYYYYVTLSGNPNIATDSHSVQKGIVCVK